MRNPLSVLKRIPPEWIVAPIGIALGTWMGVSQAFAQASNCAPRDVVVPRLEEAYGEVRQSIGLAANNQVMEVFANTDSGSWTVTVTLPSGMMCLIASGMAYETTAEAPGVDG